MKRIHLFIRLALFFLSIASCREEDPLSATGDATPVRLCVVADNFVSTAGTTRATEEGYVTKFATGDRIGIFAVSATAGVLDKNIPYKYSGTAWVPVDAANTMHRYDNYLDDVTYFAYYPYSTDMDAKKSEQEIIDAFIPKTNQTLYADYTASDLMTGAGTLTKAGDAYTLTFKLAHKMTLLVLCPDPYANYKAPAGAGYEYHPKSGIKSTVANAKINNASTYAVRDDTYRLIVKPGTMDVPLEYTLGSTTTSYTFTGLALTAGTYRQFNIGHDASATVVRDLKVGDFYYYDGTNAYLIPGDDTLTPEQQAACIGIVYSTDISRIGDGAKKVLTDEKGVTTPHGLVMALTNASESCKWGPVGRDENSGGIAGEPFKENTTDALRQGNVDGYAETQWMLTNHTSDWQYSNNAFAYADRYGTDESSRYAAPSDKTTGWFIPSTGQWWDILSNLGGVNPSASGVAQTALNNLNKYLNKIDGAMQFQTDRFWSSSEKKEYAAYHVDFSQITDFIGGINKSYDYKVRCIFAF